MSVVRVDNDGDRIDGQWWYEYYFCNSETGNGEWW